MNMLPTNWICVQTFNGVKVGGLQALSGPQKIAIPYGLVFDNILIRAIGGSIVLTSNGGVPAIGDGRSYDDSTDYLDSAENAHSIQVISDGATHIYVEFYRVK